MEISSILLGILFVLNLIFAVIVIFLERKDAGATWAWLMVLFFIPFLGFIMYLLFGQNLSRRRLFDWDNIKKVGIEDLIEEQVTEIKSGIYPFRHEEIARHKELIYMHLVNDDAVLTQDNSIRIFTDGEEKFDALLDDLSRAQDHIHFQYYIFQKDNLGRKIVQKLAQKARDGVKVRVLYDEMGSRKTRKRFFRELIEAGGEVEVFFPSRIPYVNTRLNYRNHRKLVIIDGNLGYVGGFNVGDEYLGLKAKFGYWRDTHLRIEGSATLAMQTRFLLDWNHAARHKVGYEACYFPIVEPKGKAGVQIVSSGPDSEWEQIKNGYIKLISSANHTVFIQTPYFIPDASLLDALRIAALSGVDVRLMIPNKPDHPFVYWATYSYVGELLKAGAKVYIYQNGFIHAKTIAVDGEISSVGTANIDVRSFRLNFEVNAFIYDEDISKQLEEVFINDMEKSVELTLEGYHERSMWIRFKESISRLLSPIL
ncbi:cardiolipin synthase [Guptibacillus hwajinpoensis]|uniref:Cardiolipin synthase n=1 Tax=Guptibacillus hwajinpoensis TaxID=208199 RepID=A0ABU0JXF3_9BACL|nr:cardiolipin synthase [Alkalihalobacillus hemicentroti]MDQ0481760.1 cardiolipin synthase [Alkalihalobacillus hemicentroti]